MEEIKDIDKELNVRELETPRIIEDTCGVKTKDSGQPVEIESKIDGTKKDDSNSNGHKPEEEEYNLEGKNSLEVVKANKDRVDTIEIATKIQEDLQSNGKSDIYTILQDGVYHRH